MAYNPQRWNSCSDDPYNELDYVERLKAERNAPPWTFFNNTGNPFLGFMQFLRRKPVPKKYIDPQRLMSDLGQIAHTNKVMGVCAVLCFVLLIVVFIVFKGFGFILCLCFFAILLMIFFKYKGKKTSNGYTVNDYKAYVIEQSIAPIVDEIVYEPNFGIPKNVLRDAHVVRFGNRYHTEDLVTGKYHGVYFVQADLDSEAKSKHNTTIFFKGKWVIIKYPKAFAGTVTVIDKDYKYRVKKNKWLDSVALENETFNNMFITESSDQHLAFYLLTPQLMERLMYIKQSAHGSVVLCFKDGYLHIGVNDYKDTFEPNYKQLNLYGDIEKFKYEFSLVSGLIEILDVDKSVYNQQGFYK